MFKVICTKKETKESDLWGCNVKPCNSLLHVGSEYSVISLVIGPKGQTYYGLSEIPPPDVFNSNLFATLDGPDERSRLAIWQEENAQVDAFFAGLAQHTSTKRCSRDRLSGFGVKLKPPYEPNTGRTEIID
jgi:hypothetical protein